MRTLPVPAFPMVAAALLLTATPAPAGATWSTAGDGTAVAVATSVPQGDSPTVTPPPLFNRTFTLTWDTTRVGGTPAVAYLVRRTGGTTTMTNTTCDDRTTAEGISGVFVPADLSAATHSCTDTIGGLATGQTYQWTVQPIYRLWRGPASAPASGTL